MYTICPHFDGLNLSKYCCLYFFETSLVLTCVFIFSYFLQRNNFKQTISARHVVDLEVFSLNQRHKIYVSFTDIFRLPLLCFLKTFGTLNI